MYSLLQRINTYLMRWARKKYKRLRSWKRFKAWWRGLTETGARAVRSLGMDAQRTSGQGEKSGMTGDCHVPFRGRTRSFPSRFRPPSAARYGNLARAGNRRTGRRTVGS